MDNAITIKDLFRIITETDFSNNSILSAEELDKIAREYLPRKNKIDMKTAEANEAYKQGRHKEALAHYTEIISLIQESNSYVKRIGDFLKKKQEEEAGKSSAFYPAKLYGSFYEATCEVLEKDAEALATMHTMRGIVNRDLGNLTDE